MRVSVAFTGQECSCSTRTQKYRHHIRTAVTEGQFCVASGYTKWGFTFSSLILASLSKLARCSYYAICCHFRELLSLIRVRKWRCGVQSRPTVAAERTDVRNATTSWLMCLTGHCHYHHKLTVHQLVVPFWVLHSSAFWKTWPVDGTYLPDYTALCDRTVCTRAFLDCPAPVECSLHLKLVNTHFNIILSFTLGPLVHIGRGTG